MLILITTAVILLLSSVSGQGCQPRYLTYGASVVCECNSTYCDFYPDPEPPNKGEFIWYLSSKSGHRLKRTDGKVSSESKDGISVKINPTKTFQSINGFGGAFTDSAGFNIKALSEGCQDNILRSYFSTNGSNYNLGRVPIAGTDFSTRAYSYAETENDTMLRYFQLAEEDFKYKIPLMKKALELNPSLRFVSASWTAPIWMKNKPSYNGFTYLLEQYYQTFADYIIRFLEEYQKHGLSIWAVSTGNEPFTSLIPISHINSMFWSANTASKWIINNLGPSLQKSNSNNTLLLMLDDQRAALPWYFISVKMNHPEALEYVAGIAVHWYTDDFIPASVLDVTHSMIPDKFLLTTEACVGDRPWETQKVILGSWTRADKLIKKIFENLNHWVTGWIDWNLALNSQGGPNWVENYVDAPIIVIPEKDVFYKQPLFYAMAHFSKFIPRSSVRIEATSSDEQILTVSFQTNEKQRVVLLYNKSIREKNVSIIDDEVGNINLELPPHSLHTILYGN